MLRKKIKVKNYIWGAGEMYVILTSTPKNIDGLITNFVDTETGSNLLFGNVSDVEYHKLCVETDLPSSSSYISDTVISKYVNKTTIPTLLV